MRAIDAGDAPGPAGVEIGDIQTQPLAALVGREERQGRSVWRHTRKRRLMRHATQAACRSQARGARLQPVAQQPRLTALASDPVLPFLRETSTAKELPDACPA